MPEPITAGMVAAELRKLADALDTTPETVIRNTFCSLSLGTKESFLAVARVLPKPFWKCPEEYEYVIDNRPRMDGKLVYAADWPAVHIQASVPRNSVCTLVEPAKPAVYKCDPILSAIEEAELETAQ